MSSAPLFLGLDSSTQSLKASLLSTDLDVLAEHAVHFDTDLPEYQTSNGVSYGPDGSGEVNSPVMMVVQALDLLFDRMKDAGWELDRVRGISAAGQQHASVYWSHEAPTILSLLDPKKTLHSQLSGAFSRCVIPNWQDSSTSEDCQAIESFLGGPEVVAKITGSRAYERFTGPQIRRFKRLDPNGYGATSRVSLVSSFITTLMCADGEIKGIDESDACGMNLWAMNGSDRGWDKRCLQAVVGSEDEEEVKELERKLGRVETDGGKVVGKLGKWFQERYTMSGVCCVFPGTGDNPATFLSLTLKEREGMISLGTSDVLLVSVGQYLPNLEYHSFFHPAQIAPPSSQDEDKERTHEGLRYFNMLVYKNGSLPRSHIRDDYFDGSWDKFNSAVEKHRPKSGDGMERMGFWWLLPDIIPSGAHGTYKYQGQSGDLQLVEEFSDPSVNAITILHSQFLNYRSRSSAFLTSSSSPTPSPSTSPPSSPFPPRRGIFASLKTHPTPKPTQSSTHTLEEGDNKKKTSVGIPHLSRVYATGGAAANSTLLSVLSDVLHAPICKNVEFSPTSGWTSSNWNACSVGAAYKAKWGWERHVGVGERQNVGFDQVVREARMARRVTRLGPEGREGWEEEGITMVVGPDPERAEVYESWVDDWKELERRSVRSVEVNA
ncbi:hypothetical protein M231_05244 [Tremella mesenterica]|uniref:Xylulose kinase n=1 Tax=Tremella mesenterica TaxID=5217 RepID=A0A4Q1BIL6_TREME|nr:hypothetical protein M231_05244 [Tremella mesenterica]